MESRCTIEQGWSGTFDCLAEYLAAKEFITTRLFDAPRELVFAAWSDPKHLAQ